MSAYTDPWADDPTRCISFGSERKQTSLKVRSKPLLLLKVRARPLLPLKVRYKAVDAF